MPRSVTKQEIIDDIEQLRKRSEGTDQWVHLTYTYGEESFDIDEWELERDQCHEHNV
jgi:hypothetical protein